MLPLILLARALAAEPQTSADGADESERRIDALLDCAVGHELECETPVRADCTAGKLLSCAWLGSTIARDKSRRAEALPLLVAACEGAGLQCPLAVELSSRWPGEPSTRGLLGRACDAGDARSCALLGDSWDENYDADSRQVAAAMERACALKEEYCVPWGIALVRGSPSDLVQGLSVLRSQALSGNAAALTALTAIYWGARENLPKDLDALLAAACTSQSRREVPTRCPALLARLEAGGR